jgi:hypothetical protein
VDCLLLARRVALAAVLVGEFLIVFGSFQSGWQRPVLAGAGVGAAVTGAVAQYLLARQPCMRRR